MKKRKLKKIFFIIAAIVLSFGAYNIFWYFSIISKYKDYSENMDELIAYKSYFLNPHDGYLYNVKYPDYLTFTGNLGISDEKNNLALIIWPSLYGENEYGVRIITDEETYEIMVDKNMKAANSSFNSIIDEYKEEIEKLFEKANKQWNIID